MLYERWRAIARERGHTLALREAATGLEWSFTQLAAATESAVRGQATLACAQGQSAEFVLDVLKAWRNNRVLCPLEAGQGPPEVPPPPTWSSHLKITSGTTGTARTIAFRGEQLAADADNIVATMGLRPDWPNLGAISLAHSYGFSNLVLPLLLHGIPLILAPSPLPEMVRRAAQGVPDLTLAAVPALWRAWQEAGAIPPQTRLAISAGAPLPGSIEGAVFEACGLKIHNFYGSSECGGIAYDAAATPRVEEGYVGTPLRHVRINFSEEDCIEVHSRAVGETYWPEPDPALGSGRFQTSDLGRLHGGVLQLLGRLGDQINVAGRKVSPAAIERVLATHEAVRECLVFGVPSEDSDRSETIVACVAPSGQPSAEVLKHYLLERLPAWQVPRKWWFVKTLEANARGKLSRVEWRARYLRENAG
jgi:long-chain acyl-CoA synthetase